MKVKNIIYMILFVSFLTFFKSVYSKEKTDSLETNAYTEEKIKNDNIPIFSHESGFYIVNNVRELTIKSKDMIYYTLDSSDPTTSKTAQIYTKPILMYDRSYEPNVYSKYQHEDNSPYSIILKTKYIANKALFDKATIVRAVSKSNDGQFSKIVTKVYFIMGYDKLKFYSSIPVISIVTDPENLFDKDKGIYVCGEQYLDWLKGPEFDPKKGEYDARNTANFFSRGKEWEREATITYFKNGELGFSQNMGIRIKGASTRNHINKSFNIYARSKYGDSKLKYNLFDNNFSADNGKKIEYYESFSLRGISWTERYRENIIQPSLVEFPELATFDNNRCILFLDGEFWGLYDLMEKPSDYYIQSNYGVPAESVSLIKNGVVEEGPESEYNDLKELSKFCNNNSLSISENYDFVLSKIDKKSIIEHYCTGYYIGIWDWPNSNYFMWKNNGKSIDGNIYSDGKWRFGSFDFDFSVGITYESFGGVEGYAFDSFQKYMGYQSNFPSSIFTALLGNSEFKQLFVETFCHFAYSVFESSKMKAVIEEREKRFMKYMILDGWRWKSGNEVQEFVDYSKEKENNLKGIFNVMKNFFEHRAKYIIKYMKNYLGIDDIKCQKTEIKNNNVYN